MTGNTLIDAVAQHIQAAERKSRILEKVSFSRFALAIIHRAENVNNPAVLKDIMEAFMESPIPIVCPLYPRTKKKLKQMGMYAKISRSQNLQVLPPVGYWIFRFL